MIDASTDMFADADGRLTRRRRAASQPVPEPYALDEDDAFDPGWSSINPVAPVVEPVIPRDRPEAADRAVVAALMKPTARGPRVATGPDKPVKRRHRRVLAKPTKKATPARVLRPFVARESVTGIAGHVLLLTAAVGLLVASAMHVAPQPIVSITGVTLPDAAAAWAGVASLAVLLVGLFLAVRIVAGSFFANLAALAGGAASVAGVWAGESALLPIGLASLSLGLVLSGWRTRSTLLLILAGAAAGVAVAIDGRALATMVPVVVASALLLQPRRGRAGVLPAIVAPAAAIVAWMTFVFATGAAFALSVPTLAWPAAVEMGAATTLLFGLGGLGLLAMLARRPEAGLAVGGWSVAMYVGFGGLTLAVLPGVLVGAAYALWRVLAAPIEGRGRIWRSVAASIAMGAVVAWFILTLGITV